MNLEKFKNLEGSILSHPVYYPGCGTTIPDPQCSDCPDKELGGLRSFWLQKETFAFSDITDPAEWATAIANKDVYVFPKSRGSLEQTEVESPGFGDQTTVTDGYDFVANVMEPNFNDNVDFWNAIKKSNNYRLGWRTESKIFLTDDAVGIIPKAPVAEDIKTAILWNIMFKFSQEDYPTPNDVPGNIFDQCVAVS